AIVGEFFAGFGADDLGLGALILQTSGRLQTAYLFAAIFTATLLGLLLFGLVTVAGAVLLRRWPGHEPALSAAPRAHYPHPRRDLRPARPHQQRLYIIIITAKRPL